MKVQWYPGHMTKARRAMQADIKLIDLLIELLDARIPLSSRNPDIDKLAEGKFRLVLLNKADLADPEITKKWIEHFREQGIRALALDSRATKNVRAITALIPEICREKIEKDRKKGILNRPIRAMVAGIPNVGKSTLINSIAGKSSAATGNKPGVTRGNQWIRLNKAVELLDTPGILWPKFEDEDVGTNLALIGSVNDDILDKNELARDLVNKLCRLYPEVLPGRYGIEQGGSPSDMIEAAAKRRGCLRKGGEIDIDRISAMMIDEFRSGKLGRLSFESPQKTVRIEENGDAPKEGNDEEK